MSDVSALPWPAERCPACLEAVSTQLSDGTRLCLNCRHEWNPSETVGPLPSLPGGAAEPSRPADVVSIVPPTAQPLGDTLAQARATYVGRDVHVFSCEAIGTVIDIDDGGYARVEFGSGYYVDALPDDFALVDTSGIPDETINALGMIDLQCAAQVLRAAAETIIGDDTQRMLGLPPNGWLPEDVDTLPVVEHGAAYAVAHVAILAGVTVHDLRALADGLDQAAYAAKEGTAR